MKLSEYIIELVKELAEHGDYEIDRPASLFKMTKTGGSLKFDNRSDWEKAEERRLGTIHDWQIERENK